MVNVFLHEFELQKPSLDLAHFRRELGVRAEFTDGFTTWGDDFQLLVRSLNISESPVSESAFEWRGNSLVLARWEPSLIQEAVEQLGVQSEASSWSELQVFLAQYLVPETAPD